MAAFDSNLSKATLLGPETGHTVLLSVHQPEEVLGCVTLRDSKFEYGIGAAKLETRILIVDDSPLVRQRLREMLQQHPHWKVCGEAPNGKDAVQKVQELAPDLIVLDFLMPGMDGLQAAREIGKVVPNIPILMFTMHLSRQLVEEARNAGIRGAVAKSDAGRIIEGLEALLRNEAFFYSSN